VAELRGKQAPDPLAQARVMTDTFHEVDLVAMLADDPETSPIGRAIREIAHPDLETVMVAPAGDPAIRNGVAGYVALWTDWVGAFDRFVLEEVDEPQVNGEVVVNFVRQRGKLAGSEAEVTADGAGVWFFRDGRLARIEFHLDREAALRAAGL
jgi:ketosteroid isomerase-like protein